MSTGIKRAVRFGTEHGNVNWDQASCTIWDRTRHKRFKEKVRVKRIFQEYSKLDEFSGLVNWDQACCMIWDRTRQCQLGSNKVAMAKDQWGQRRDCGLMENNSKINWNEKEIGCNGKRPIGTTARLRFIGRKNGKINWDGKVIRWQWQKPIGTTARLQFIGRKSGNKSE